jgi:hypothetical protein
MATQRLTEVRKPAERYPDSRFSEVKRPKQKKTIVRRTR